ncbi:MAG: hypothetical protein RLZZ66_747 [Pseudomonadota bacterium]|jgi:hypothetical protein
MLGRIFTEFFTLVEAEFGEDMLDDIIEDAKLPNEGAYTAVGNYDDLELIRLVMALSARTHIAVPDLVKTFGTFIFERLMLIYPKMTENISDLFVFLLGIDSVVHVEVKKLYPNASLPKFHSSIQEDTLIMVYQSDKNLPDLAEGLIIGAGRYFSENLMINRRLLDDGSTEFRITR